MAHELGHVLDRWVLGYFEREAVAARFCTHEPRHAWVNNADTPWVFTIGEDFANTYAFLFHGGMSSPGAGHSLTEPDQEWLRSWLPTLNRNP